MGVLLDVYNCYSEAVSDPNHQNCSGFMNLHSTGKLPMQSERSELCAKSIEGACSDEQPIRIYLSIITLI